MKLTRMISGVAAATNTLKQKACHVVAPASAYAPDWNKIFFVGALIFAVDAASVAAVAAPTSAPALKLIDTSKWKPMRFARPPLSAASARRTASINSKSPLGMTVPFWTTQITSPLDGNTYTVSMVGGSPYDSQPKNTHVSYVPIALRIHIGGVVIDPTAVSHCDTQSAAQRFFNSPLFVPNTFISNGVNVSAGVPGGTQLISAFQRANFWNAVKGTNYGVTFVPTQNKVIVVDWTPTDPNDSVVGVPDNCGGIQPFPLVSIDEFDAEVQAIAATYAQPQQVPITLYLDTAIYVLENPSYCCVVGYHNAISVAKGTQLYALGAYVDTNAAFGPDSTDVSVWSHELAELVDDPFVQYIAGAPGGYNNDLTPAWGNTGQVPYPYCQNDLEVGDPLSPDQTGDYPAYRIAGVGGFVYHYQDLAFHDWFYRTPSSSTGGMGSFAGNFAGGGQPKICQ